MPRTLMASCLLALALAPAAVAQETRYVIDGGHTHVQFSVERFGFADTIGIFPDSSGHIILDQETPENSRVVAEVRTPTVWTGLAERDEAVRSPFFLNAEAHDTIRFESTAVERTGEDQARVTGQLTIWGQSRPASFDVTLNRIGPDPSLQGREGVGFSLTGEISRSAFGHETAAALIGDVVSIRIEVLAHAEG